MSLSAISHSIEHTRQELNSGLTQITLGGTRPCTLHLSTNLLDALEKHEPKVASSIFTAVSRYPSEWPQHMHGRETGQLQAKRAINIPFSRPLSIVDTMGRPQSCVAVQVVGVLFSEKNLREQIQHTGHFIGNLNPSEFLSMIMGPFEDPIARQAMINLLGGPDAFQANLLAQSKSVEFDPSGMPVFSSAKPSLLGGHGAQTAQKKFEHAVTTLPQAGIQGPCALGYGEFSASDFTIAGSKLGVYVAMIRSDEPIRLGEYIEREISNTFESSNRSYLQQQSSVATRIEEGTMSRDEALRELSKLERTLRDPIVKMAQDFPLASHKLAVHAYGRALRRLLGDDLTDLHAMIIPHKFPHQGNLAIDFSRPHPDGGFIETWYDLGGWKFGKEMTREQAFGYVYSTLDYGLNQVLLHLAKPGSPQSEINRLLHYHPEREFLAGFFFDRTNDLDFLGWQVTPVGAHLNTSETILDYQNQPNQPAPHQRYEMPFVRLLARMMDFPVPDRGQLPKGDIERILLQQLPKTITGHRSFSKAKQRIVEELSEKSEEEAISQESVTNIFRKHGLSLSDRSKTISSLINKRNLERIQDERRISFEPPLHDVINQRAPKNWAAENLPHRAENGATANPLAMITPEALLAEYQRIQNNTEKGL
jgi:hypothetical protein